VAAREHGPIAQIRETIPRWLDLLSRGQDEQFLDEAIVPEQLEKVLGSRSKAQLVVAFKEDKHDGVVKVLTRVRDAKPRAVRQEGARAYVEFEGDRESRHITFVVEGAHVWIEN